MRDLANGCRLALLALAGCLIAAVATLGWSGGFAWFGVPALEPPFADLRTIPAALAAAEAGLDPRLANPGDPWGRPFNYPDVWLWLFAALARLGDPVAMTGIAQAALLLALALRLADRGHGPFVLLCAASPVMLLLIERGNHDGLVFLLTLAGLRGSGMAAGMALGLAAGLKLYPLAAAPIAAWATGSRGRRLGLLLAGPLVLWALLQWREIAAATPQGFWQMSFGAPATSLMLAEALRHGPISLPSLLTRHPALIGHAGFLLAALAFWRAARGRYVRLDALIAAAPAAESRMVTGFALTFVALFLSGSSFAYRCVFLLPVLWFLHAHRREPSCRWLLASGLALLWFPWLPHGWELINVPALLLAGALAPLLALCGLRVGCDLLLVPILRRQLGD